MDVLKSSEPERVFVPGEKKPAGLAVETFGMQPENIVASQASGLSTYMGMSGIRFSLKSLCKINTISWPSHRKRRDDYLPAACRDPANGLDKVFLDVGDGAMTPVSVSAFHNKNIECRMILGSCKIGTLALPMSPV